MTYVRASVVTVVAIILAVVPSGAFAGGAFIAPFHTVSTLASTIPPNGDLNPYGIAVVPASSGNLVQGDVLISNFNASSNLQGTGTTIVEITPGGSVSLFAQINASSLPGPCPGGVGLTTALVVLRTGWVVVGSLPTTDGMADTAQAGCLIVLNNLGQPVETFAGGHINGPWDMTALDEGSRAFLFVTNVLNGTVGGGGKIVRRGTALRLNLTISNGVAPVLNSTTVIGSEFPQRTDPAALVIGPTGVGLSGDALYVADSLDNRIARIDQATTRTTSAGTGATVSVNGALNDPLGLTIAPNGDVLTVNGNNGKMVETSDDGEQLAVRRVDTTGHPPGAGTLFGLAVVPDGSGVYFVDDGSNTLNLLS